MAHLFHDCIASGYNLSDSLTVSGYVREVLVIVLIDNSDFLCRAKGMTLPSQKLGTFLE